MICRSLALLAFAVLSPGCVPVSEPVGDITKAKADKSLVGSWAADEKPEKVVVKIEIAPEVKGNPKGLMRMIFVNEGNGKAGEVPVHFFLTTVGKHQYGNLLMDSANAKEGIASLGTEGEYARWSKGTSRAYFVFRAESHKDGITLNFGDENAFKKLMADEKIVANDKTIFKTPAGWLAKYLEKHGHDTIFPAAKDAKMVKAKK